MLGLCCSCVCGCLCVCVCVFSCSNRNHAIRKQILRAAQAHTQSEASAWWTQNTQASHKPKRFHRFPHINGVHIIAVDPTGAYDWRTVSLANNRSVEWSRLRAPVEIHIHIGQCQCVISKSNQRSKRANFVLHFMGVRVTVCACVCVAYCTKMWTCVVRVPLVLFCSFAVSYGAYR